MQTTPAGQDKKYFIVGNETGANNKITIFRPILG
jgi:hypothetical protein